MASGENNNTAQRASVTRRLFSQYAACRTQTRQALGGSPGAARRLGRRRSGGGQRLGRRRSCLCPQPRVEAGGGLTRAMRGIGHARYA